MAFPSRDYYSVSMMASRWNVLEEDVHYVIENGLLRSCVHLPMRWMEYGHFEGKKFIVDETEHCEGIVGLRAVDTRRIFTNGKNNISIFESLRKRKYLLRLANEPYQPPLRFNMQDLVIRREDCTWFESKHQVEVHYMQGKVKLLKASDKKPANNNSVDWHISNDFQHVSLHGRDYQLGNIQAKVFKQLHEVVHTDNPWLYGKTVLHEVGSTSLRMRDVFKSQPDWKELIRSDGRGFYALNVPAEVFAD